MTLLHRLCSRLLTPGVRKRLDARSAATAFHAMYKLALYPGATEMRRWAIWLRLVSSRFPSPHLSSSSPSPVPPPPSSVESENNAATTTLVATTTPSSLMSSSSTFDLHSRANVFHILVEALHATFRTVQQSPFALNHNNNNHNGSSPNSATTNLATVAADSAAQSNETSSAMEQLTWIQSSLRESLLAMQPRDVLVVLEACIKLDKLGLADQELLALAADRAPTIAVYATSGHRKARDLVAVLRVIALSEREWNDPQVVQDLQQALQVALESDATTHQDAMLLFDALTRRSEQQQLRLSAASSENLSYQSDTFLFPIPPPLLPLGGMLLELVERQCAGLSPAQVVGWTTRILDARLVTTRRIDSSDDSQDQDAEADVGLAPSPSHHGHPAADRLYEKLLQKLAVPRFMEALTDSAVFTIGLTMNKRLTAPLPLDAPLASPLKQEGPGKEEGVEGAALERRERGRRVVGVDVVGKAMRELVRRATRLVSERNHEGATCCLNAAVVLLLATPPAVLRHRMRDEVTRGRGSQPVCPEQMELILAMNQIVVHLANNDRLQHGNEPPLPVSQRNDKQHQKLNNNNTRPHASLPDRVGTLPPSLQRSCFDALSSRHRVQLLIYVLLQFDVLTTTTVAQSSVPKITLETVTLLDRALRRVLPRHTALVDLVTLVNELSGAGYQSARRGGGRPSYSRGNNNNKGDAASQSLPGIIFSLVQAAHQVVMTLDVRRLSSSISTGQLVRYLTSMSKMGIRKKWEYSTIAGLLAHKRTLTPFELVRLGLVLGRHQIVFPLFTKMVVETILIDDALLQSASVVGGGGLQPSQRVLLVKTLGQMHLTTQHLDQHIATALTTQQQKKKDSSMEHWNWLFHAERLGLTTTGSGSRSELLQPVELLQWIVGCCRMIPFPAELPSVYQGPFAAARHSMVRAIVELERDQNGSPRMRTIETFVTAADLVAVGPWLYRQFYPNDAPVRSLLHKAVRHLRTLHTSLHTPFADLLRLGESWSALIALDMGEGITAAPPRPSSSGNVPPPRGDDQWRDLLEALRIMCHDALLVRLRDMAEHASRGTLSSTSFLFSQLFLGSTFGVHHTLGAAAWHTLVQLLPLHELPKLISTNPLVLWYATAVLTTQGLDHLLTAEGHWKSLPTQVEQPSRSTIEEEPQNTIAAVSLKSVQAAECHTSCCRLFVELERQGEGVLGPLRMKVGPSFDEQLAVLQMMVSQRVALPPPA